jgi:ssRNA-specific RNase YbeY (16S rRNA maturation enzyme)
MIRSEITVLNEQDKFFINEKILQEICYKMLEYVLSEAEIFEHSALRDYNVNSYSIGFDVLICDNKRIREINREYRKQDRVMT